MICGTVIQLDRFGLLEPAVRQSLEYARSHDLAPLETGRYNVDGDALYFNMIEDRLVALQTRLVKTPAQDSAASLIYAAWKDSCSQPGASCLRPCCAGRAGVRITGRTIPPPKPRRPDPLRLGIRQESCWPVSGRDEPCQS